MNYKITSAAFRPLVFQNFRPFIFQNELILKIIPYITYDSNSATAHKGLFLFFFLKQQKLGA